MNALVTRELIVAARRAGAPLMMCVTAALLTGFVLVWSPGVSILAPMNLYEQTRLLHWVLLAVVLPWTAVRSAAADRRDGFVSLAAFIALRPATIVAGKTIAMTGLLLMVVLTGIPALVLAQQAAAVPLTSVLQDLIPLVGVAILIAATTVASVLLLPDSFGAWMTSTVVVSVVLLAANWLAPEGSVIGLVSALAGVTGTAAIGSWSNGTLRYLRSGDAG